MEFDLTLLEEIGNCGAHTPGYNQAMKCWEAVTAALVCHMIIPGQFSLNGKN
jgi:hypothetical protein